MHRTHTGLFAATLAGLLAFTLSVPAYAGGGMNCGFGDFPFVPGLDDKTDHEVIRLFPTYAVVSPDGKSLLLPLRVWVFEPEHDDKLRKVAIKAGAQKLDIADGTPERAVYERRMRAFLVDNERGERLTATISGRGVGKKPVSRNLGPTEKDGQFETVLTIPYKPKKKGADSVQLSIRGFDREAAGRSVTVPVIAAEGITVISDIDDTFKVTNVLDKKEMAANTFTREFHAVPGMARLYEAWAKQGVTFHYVSASPWALQQELATFAEKTGFPSAVYHLRSLRLKDVAGTTEFVRESREHKLASISELFERFPKRTFILVGDSGEKDPEIYGEIAQKFGERVTHIYIREVPGAANTKDRFAAAFKDVPASKWTTFADPATVDPP